MSRNTNTIPRAPVGRILIRAGAKRISAEAVNTFAEILENIATDIAIQANKIAKHSGRKTIHDSDIKLSVR